MSAAADRGYGASRQRLRPVLVDSEEERRLLDLSGGIIRSRVRGGLRLIAYLLLTLTLAPVQAAAVALRLRASERIPMLYHRIATRILGLRVTVRGTRVRERPVLFVGNHISYLDILVLGALIPGCFVAKSEVAGWPGFGLLAKLQRTVFVRRERTQVARHGDEIAARLANGDNLILFAEGTSSDGTRVLPFKSGLLAVAEREVEGRPLTVQPFSIAYTRLNGVPLGRGMRPLYAWYGDMELLPHLLTMVCLGDVTVAVEFHAPTTLSQTGTRKELARTLRGQVAAGVSRANAGR